MTINKVKTVSLYGITHAIIDATCIMVLYSTIIFNNLPRSYSFSMIVFYNIAAFGLQSIIGNIFDRINKPKLSAIIGCILTALAALLWKYPIPAVILAGLGNAFFHVGGGIICLKLGNGKSAIPGMYVAPGAFGLFAGALIAKEAIFPAYIFACLLFIMSLLILTNRNKEITEEEVAKPVIQMPAFMLICNFLLIAIAIRSFIGLSISIPWHEHIWLMLLLTIAIVCGKFFGGIIADKFGWIKVTVIALLISSPLIAFGIKFPLLYITGMFFFNFTMPVTLTALSNIMPKREGFAFGLTTLALIIGGFPSFYINKLKTGNELIIFTIVIFSAILIYFGLKKYKDSRI